MLDNGCMVKTKEMLERENEYMELCKSSEVKSYQLSDEEIVRKYGKTKSEKKRDVIGLSENKWIKNSEGKSVRFGVDIIKKDILKGLTKEDIFKKYDTDKNVKSRFFNIAIRQLLSSGEITQKQAENIQQGVVSMSKEMASLIAMNVVRVFQGSLGISFEEAFAETKKLYGVK